MGRRAGSRNYPPSYKRRVVRETFESGRSVAAVARDHGLNANMVFCWRRDPRFAPPPNTDEEPLFLPVAIGTGDVAPSARANAEAAANHRLEIVLNSGHRLNIEGSFDGAAVAELLKALTER